MKRLRTIFAMMLSVAVLLTGCMKDDIDELREQQAENAARIATLEQWKETVNGNISALQSLVSALQANDYVTGVTAFTTPAPGGYRITFSKSGEATIWNGAKGETGNTGAAGQDGKDGKNAPVVGVKKDTDNKYYWTLDGQWITDSGNKMPVTGPKGDSGQPGANGKSAYELAVEKGYTGTLDQWLASLNGTNGMNGKSAYEQAVENGYTGSEVQWLADLKGATGDPGQPGADGKTPKVAIGENGNWYISADGSATGKPGSVGATGNWTDTGVKATGDTGPAGPQGPQGDAIFATNGVDNTNPNYVEFTLADGTTKIQVPKYKNIGITFDQPGVFKTVKSVQTISFMSTGTVSPTNIRVVNVPSGWKITVNSNNFRITAPAAFTAENFRGEATVLVGDGNQVAAMYSLSLRGTGGFYKVGDYYPDPYAVYESGVLKSGTAAVGVVFWLTGQVDGDYPYDAAGKSGLIVSLYERAADHLFEPWAADYGTTYSAGTGWYMPATNNTREFDYLYCAYNGMAYQTWGAGKPTDLSKNYGERTWFRNIITDAGGHNLTDSWYWATTRDAIGNAYRLHFNSGNKEISGYSLSSNKMRAVKAF